MRGGITTAAAVTEIAGRGIGLDVVREVADRLGGSVEVATEPGKGTRFELAVPSSLVAIEALTIQAAGRVVSVPLEAVRATVLLGADAISRGAGTATILHDAEAIPFLWLPHALGGGLLPGRRKWPTIIVAAPGGVAAVGFDRLRRHLAHRRAAASRAGADPRDRFRRLARCRWQSPTRPQPRRARRGGQAAGLRRRRAGARAPPGSGRGQFADHADARAKHPRIRGVRGRSRGIGRGRARYRAPPPLCAVPRRRRDAGDERVRLCRAGSRRSGAARHSGRPGHLASRAGRLVSAGGTRARKAISSRASSTRPGSRHDPRRWWRSRWAGFAFSSSKTR